MRIRRALSDSTTQLLKLSALDDHIRGSLRRDIEAAGLPVDRVDARLADLPHPDRAWHAVVRLVGGTTLMIECVARRRLMIGRLTVIHWRATAQIAAKPRQWT